jgi:NADH-quinone oxidoreductase subunit L
MIAAGLILAAIGKSAQLPLQTWLSGAMAGPTPVSALLHSATMVAAGVYLLIRSQELLAGWPLEVVGWLGALTAVLAAGIALAQADLKKVLAGSTTSQLGLMFVGLAAGGPVVALFQLIAHAAGKAGLFLAAGIFQHSRGTTSLAGLRGAGREDPTAFAGFVVCALSIAAVPPFAVFWSKDHIAASAEASNGAWLLLVLVAAAGSAAYLLRPALTLWRDPHTVRARGDTRGRTAMLAGLLAMVVGSVTLGVAGGPLTGLVGAPELPTGLVSLILSLGAVLLGAVIVLAPVRVPDRMVAAFRNQLYVDEGIRAVVSRPVLSSAAASDFADRRWIDGLVGRIAGSVRRTSRSMDGIETGVIDAVVDGTGRSALRTARSQQWLEQNVIDAAVDGIAEQIGRSGNELKGLQSGRLYEYLRDAVIGAVVIGFLIALAALL